MVKLNLCNFARRAAIMGLAVCLVLFLLVRMGVYTSSDAAASQGGGESSRLVAAAAAPLGTASTFAVLASQTVTNTGPTMVNGNLGVSPGSAVTGFPPGTVTGGTVHSADAVAVQAQMDTTTAYNNLAGQVCNTNLTGQNLGGLTLTPGVYCFNTSAQLTGAVTLDARGDSNAVFVFQMGTTLTTATTAGPSSVLGINSPSGQICNVFWQVGSSATLGSPTSFAGNILALASITLTHGASVSGRALARTGGVTMDSNNVSASSCLPATIAAATPTPTPTPTPTGVGGSPTPTSTPTATASPASSPTPSATSTPGCATVSYASGWNLAGGPTGTVLTGAAGSLLTFQASDTNYETFPVSTTLSGGMGVWAFFFTPTTVTLPCVTGTTQSILLPANHFIMVGNPFDKPATLTGAQVVDTFNPATNSYTAATGAVTLGVGQGAWVFSSTGGTLIITSS